VEAAFRDFLTLLNETLASAIVIVSASLLLYNLTRNVHNRVARTSGVVLACVTIAYAADVLLSLNPGVDSAIGILRFQWIGLSFIPAATFHVSDALLATTGLPSRGRRRRAARFQYAVATVFMLLAAFTDLLVTPEVIGDRVSLRAGPLFAVYLAFFISANGLAFAFVNRARERCLTRGTQRRMAYLQAAMLMPSIGIFPLSVFLDAGQEFTIGVLFLVNAANVIVILMLLLLSYPLSFFGSEIPDRVVKADLLRFMVLGPGTGLAALVVMIYTAPATELIGIAGTDFMPFAVVSIILIWQWTADISLPWLERRLIYNQNDDSQLARIESLSERLLTRRDLLQLLEATLEATSDYLRLSSGFIATLTEDQPQIVQAIGPVSVTDTSLKQDGLPLIDRLHRANPDTIEVWNRYWIMPLYSGRNLTATGEPTLIGMMGVEARSDQIDLDNDECDMLSRYVDRAARTLDDMLLQTELYAALAGLLPQISITRGRAMDVEFKPGRDGRPPTPTTVLSREEVIEQVHAALKDYWGGAGMTDSRLLELVVVRNRLPEQDNNPVKALRSVINEAIDNQRPEGEPSMRKPEWTLYNILQQRFLKERKVRETARQLFISEANLYRKQNVAIAAVADAIIQMEQDALSQQKQTISG